jgi:hypothetical protein
MTENQPVFPTEPDRFPEPDVNLMPSQVPTARTLVVLAPFVKYGMLAIGILSFINTITGLSSGASFTEAQRFQIRSNAAANLAFYGLIGWTLSALLRGLADTLVALVDQARAAERTSTVVEVRLASALERVAAALERGPADSLAGSVQEDDDPRARHLADFHAAVEAAHWQKAAELASSFTARFPDDPEGAHLSPLLDEVKQESARTLLAKIDAAREVHDPERVLDLRDLLMPLLPADALRALDRELAVWCMSVIQKRLRTGTMGVDVAMLAGRVAESLDTTIEGASLRAALPTLRRSAGLCARCAKPYTGIEDACPECLTANGEPEIAKEESPREDPMTHGPNGDQ